MGLILRPTLWWDASVSTTEIILTAILNWRIMFPWCCKGWKYRMSRKYICPMEPHKIFLLFASQVEVVWEKTLASLLPLLFHSAIFIVSYKFDLVFWAYVGRPLVPVHSCPQQYENPTPECPITLHKEERWQQAIYIHKRAPIFGKIKTFCSLLSQKSMKTVFQWTQECIHGFCFCTTCSFLVKMEKHLKMVWSNQMLPAR